MANCPPATDKERVCSDEQSVGSFTRKCGKGRVDLADGGGVVFLDLQPDVGSDLLYISVPLYQSSRIRRADRLDDVAVVISSDLLTGCAALACIKNTLTILNEAVVREGAA